MSRRFLLLLSMLIPVVGHSQVIVGNYGIQYVSVAPSGSCSSTAPIQVATSTGTIYTCQSGSWAAVSGGGGGTGFPITLGSTSIASGSTTTSISGLTLVAPALGTPTALVLTNATGLPLAGLLGLGTGVATFLGTPTSANLAAALTDETGTGAAVFGTSPTLTTPALGTPSSAVLTNATGYTYAHLPALSANQILGALTATTPSGLTVPSCSGAQNGLLWTSGTGFSCGGIASTTTTVGTTAIGANTCSATATTVTMTGVATTSTFVFSPNADVSGVTGWGSAGGLTVDAWPTANTLNYKVCNQTASSITPSASVTFNVSAR